MRINSWYDPLVYHFSFRFLPPLSKFLSELLANRKFEGYVRCNICDAKIRLFRKDHSHNYYYGINHACCHLGKSLFTCRICDHEATSKSSMQSHIDSYHGPARRKGNFLDKSKEYHSEIKTWLKRCFGEKESLGNDDATQEELKG